ncbi:hypothetical protein LAG90_15545 [Marinilongibacter aquaticus]|uniref:hypothetical protein n=1 Tax=Marinilongibacter aquaticus TaxID=2975157 RepID=UPI0021BDAB1A|nr:hypothetical protein [Marinilongibacter aquaticus]UBM58217.1 hypothetical protein LAG90_15545 [Marinilongibacter aquaticus]
MKTYKFKFQFASVLEGAYLEDSTIKNLNSAWSKFEKENKNVSKDGIHFVFDSGIEDPYGNVPAMKFDLLAIATSETLKGIEEAKKEALKAYSEFLEIIYWEMRDAGKLEFFDGFRLLKRAIA